MDKVFTKLAGKAYIYDISEGENKYFVNVNCCICMSYDADTEFRVSATSTDMLFIIVGVNLVKIFAHANNVKCTNLRDCHMFHNTRWLPAVNNLNT